MPKFLSNVRVACERNIRLYKTKMVETNVQKNKMKEAELLSQKKKHFVYILPKKFVFYFNNITFGE